jgi:hypothetical protein
MDRRHVWIAAAALLAAACGGSDDGEGWQPNAGTAGEAGSAGQGGEAGSAGTAGAGGATGQGGAAGQAGSDKLYPLKTGASWTYKVTAVGGGSVCAAGEYTSKVIGPKSVGGKDAFEVTGWCSASPGAQVIAPGAGDEVFFYYSGEWLTLLDGNVTEGYSWSYFNTSYKWKKEGAVTVPAGTYNDCWSAVQNVSYTAYTTYCRGIGPVRSYSADLNGAGWDAQLSATTM